MHIVSYLLTCLKWSYNRHHLPGLVQVPIPGPQHSSISFLLHLLIALLLSRRLGALHRAAPRRVARDNPSPPSAVPCLEAAPRARAAPRHVRAHHLLLRLFHSTGGPSLRRLRRRVRARDPVHGARRGPDPHPNPSPRRNPKRLIPNPNRETRTRTRTRTPEYEPGPELAPGALHDRVDWKKRAAAPRALRRG